jgi:hypothetical protein
MKHLTRNDMDTKTITMFPFFSTPVAVCCFMTVQEWMGEGQYRENI